MNLLIKKVIIYNNYKLNYLILKKKMKLLGLHFKINRINFKNYSI
jgi:hypothetical protein